VLDYCSQCGKLFAGGGRLCPECAQAEEEEFERVRAYLDQHPGAEVEEVSRATGVPGSKILRYLREGRLMSVPRGATLACERCGRKVDYGRFCLPCAQELSRVLKPGRGEVSREKLRFYTFHSGEEE
jgi:predicted amidophosphoribosyltransferase